MIRAFCLALWILSPSLIAQEALWTYQAPAPSPAWDKSHWNPNGTPTLTEDLSYAFTIAADKLCYASSSEHAVVCLDLNSGKRLWSAPAEGPVRFRPVIDKGAPSAATAYAPPWP